MMTTMIDNQTCQVLAGLHTERRAALSELRGWEARVRELEHLGDRKVAVAQATMQTTKARRAVAKATNALEAHMRVVFGQLTGDLIPRLAAEAFNLYCARVGIDEGDAPESAWENYAADVHDTLQSALWDTVLWPEENGVEPFEFDRREWEREARERRDEDRAEQLRQDGYSPEQAVSRARAQARREDAREAWGERSI